MIETIYKPIIRYIKVAIYTILAKKIASKLYFKRFGRHINWNNPTEFNEKLRYLQFKTDTSLWLILADKYRVRAYLKDMGYESLLVKLYGVWDKPENIDFSELPKSFVLKTNNGCGDIIIVKDKSQVKEIEIIQRLRNNLNHPFGLNSAQLHYSHMKGCIIAEELLENDSNFSNSIVDYKFYCFDGEPKICGVFYDRQPNSHLMNSTFYDMKWRKHDEWKSPSITLPSKDISCPSKFKEMIDICKDLSRNIPFVRLDLYYIKNKIYFGEFTFTPAACDGGSLNPAIFMELGSMIHLK